MHTEKIGQFFKTWVSPQTQVGLGVVGPHKTARHLEAAPVGHPPVRPFEATGGRAARQTAPTAHPLGARKGGQNSSIALDQTGYGAIRRVHWGVLDRTFPAPYSPASAPSVENPCFGPRTRVPRSGPKEGGRNGAKPELATGMARGDA